MSLPTITQQPADVSAASGDMISFSVAATSDNGPCAYQWWASAGNGVRGNPLDGANAANLTLAASATFKAFSCVVTNASGSTTSRTAVLTITSGVSGYGSTSGSGAANFGLLANGLGDNGKEFFLDADYSNASPTGLAVPTFPYLDQKNTNAVVFRQPYEQAISSYAPLDMTVPHAELGGLYYFGDSSIRDGHAGVYVFDRLFGNIPAQRLGRGQSYTYPFQYVLSSGVSISSSDDGDLSYTGPTYSIGTLPISVDSVLQYDYFVDGNQSGYPLQSAPSLIQIGQAIVPRGKDFGGGNFPLTISGGWVVGGNGVTQILAEDDKYENYRGGILVRVRRLIAAPTLAFLINNI